jgi:hypothetical protein
MKKSERTLFHAAADISQSSVNLAWWRAKDERYDCISRNFDILKRAHNMNFSKKMGTLRK